MRPTNRLLKDLDALRADIAEEAQRIVDAWQPDDEDYDEVYGTGGPCDAVSRAVADLLAENIPYADSVEGSAEGDDHSWVAVYDDTHAYGVDIPPGVYETGGGYRWRKRRGTTITADDVVLFEIERELLDRGMLDA